MSGLLSVGAGLCVHLLLNQRAVITTELNADGEGACGGSYRVRVHGVEPTPHRSSKFDAQIISQTARHKRCQ